MLKGGRMLQGGAARRNGAVYYDDNLCVMCDVKEETIKHFMECTEYGNSDDTLVLNDIFTQDT